MSPECAGRWASWCGGGPGQRGSAAGAGSGIPGFGPELDGEREEAVLPVVRLLLGLDGDDGDYGKNGDAGDSDGLVNDGDTRFSFR